MRQGREPMTDGDTRRFRQDQCCDGGESRKIVTGKRRIYEAIYSKINHKNKEKTT